MYTGFSNYCETDLNDKRRGAADIVLFNNDVEDRTTLIPMCYFTAS